MEQSSNAKDRMVTGIVTEGTSHDAMRALDELCDNLIIANEGRIFGKVLFLSLTRSEFRSAFTAEGERRLREVAKSGRQKQTISLTSAGSEEADAAIDEALFADLYADTAF